MKEGYHRHEHSHPELSGKNLFVSIILNSLITIAQFIGGIISGSLSLLSDALHNFSDVVSLVISFIANRYARKKASIDKTFGYKRAEIVAAFINAATLIIVAVLLILEAVKRFLSPQEVGTDLVILLSIFAIFGNGFSVLLLKKQSTLNMNMRSAYLHLITDMMASVAVLIGGLLMKFYQIYWIDGLLTFGIAVYLIVMGYDLLKYSFNVLMLFTPDTIAVKQIVASVNQLPEVKGLHHVHIWQLNEEETHLEAHIDFNENISMSVFGVILEKIEVLLFNEYGINHITLQPEHQKLDSKEIIVQD